MATSAVITAPRVNRMTGTIVTAAMKLHSGLLESAHEACLPRTPQTGLRVARQVRLPVIYDSQGIDLGYRIDLIVQGTVIVEIKCVASINPVHQAQLLSYIRRSGRKPGRLINSTSTTSATASNAWSTARSRRDESRFLLCVSL